MARAGIERFIFILIFITFALGSAMQVAAQTPPEAPPYFACGTKIGEATSTSVILWLRLTQHPQANLDASPILKEGLKPKDKSKVIMPENVVPGKPGSFRVIYRPENSPESSSTKTDWLKVTSRNDYICQVKLINLLPGTNYVYSIQARATEHEKKFGETKGKFQTAPTADSNVPVSFIVSTCQAVRSIDDRQGHATYNEMLKQGPNFFVHTGDILYYDKAPFAKTEQQARTKWHTLFAYPTNRQFFQNVSSYFMKDDHDTLKNDCWPGQKYGELTFEQGLDIFRQQVPMGESTYRTFRWGKHVQIWLTENRDFRSPNRMPDGPAKTILGKAQKQWLKKTIQNSTATYRFVISPGPLVGPDKRGKNDNHSNNGFYTEGQELRDFLAAQKNTYVICGDRHWQYCSQDPKTGLLELGCGPINDQHKFGGNPGHNRKFHRYFGAKGGFLKIKASNEQVVATWWGQRKPKTRFEVLHTEILK